MNGQASGEIPPPLGQSRSLELPCDLQAVGGVCARAREFLAGAGLAAGEIDGWELVLAEAANNAVNYCRPEARAVPVRVDLLAGPEWVEVRVTDRTGGFDWPEHADLPPDLSESGRGIFLMQSLTDESCYLRSAGQNCLVLRKRRSTPPPPREPASAGMAAELAETQQTLDLMTEELASSYESLSAIFRFTAELHEGGNSEEFIHRWLGQLLAITDSDWFVLRLCDRVPGQLRVAAASAAGWGSAPLRLETQGRARLPVELAAATRRVDAWFEGSAPLEADDPLFGLAGAGCGLSHPLLVQDALVGVLSVGRHSSARPFAAGQLGVVQTFGDFLGLQIRSVQMHEEQVRARLNRRDLEIAASIQRALLPERLPSLPGSDLAGFYRSAREIGGDYYDALPAGDGNLLLVVADVMGKGLPAALFAFMFRSLVRARPELNAKPGEFLAWLNQNLFKELDRAEMFVTAQLVYFDRASGEIRVAGAGHPPLLLADSSGAVAEVSSSGPPLGIVDSAVFAQERRPFAGGLALMFTDGLIDALNFQGKLLGLEAVKAALSAAAMEGVSGEGAKQQLVGLLQGFEQGAPAADDTAFIVVARETPN